MVGFEPLLQVCGEGVHASVVLQENKVLHAYAVASVQRTLSSMVSRHHSDMHPLLFDFLLQTLDLSREAVYMQQLFFS